MRALILLLSFGLILPAAAQSTPGPVQQRFADLRPAPPREPFKDGKFEIRPDEVIVFTGGTNMVRLVEDGTFEGSLALAAKEQKPRFRSMAWEGDTVYEQWRDQNFGSWKDQFNAINASCIFTWFGQMEALDTSRDDVAFARACGALLDEFKAITPRLVVILPMAFDKHEFPAPLKGLPDNTPANERIMQLAGIMKRLAAERGAIVLDWPALESKFKPEGGPFERTSNGVHLSRAAIGNYRDMLTEALGYPKQPVAKEDWIVRSIHRKNTLWHDCWKAMNWAFAYSDRTEQPFGKGIGNYPSMAKELEFYKPLLRDKDDNIHRAALKLRPKPILASGGSPPKPTTLPPDEERATFKVRDGFDVNLFASEADGLVKPLSMRWDERGRLWAACSPSYPQLDPNTPASDYILICEDTNADGRADKFTRFAEGLTMPMGIEFTRGGVYICESTQLVFFPNDGSDKAGERQVILSGFGTGDSHQMINSLRWGPDGCLWFSQGLHIFSRIETPHGIVRFDRAGLWRFNPRTWKLQGFFGNAAAGANCWGVTFDDWGQVFHCAADNNPGFYTTPGLGTWPNPPSYYNIGSLAVSKVKGMCMEYVSSSHLPPDLNGVLCKPVYFANHLQFFKLVEDASGFKTEDLGPLLTSSSTSFRPLGVQTGPDGALYVCDWYNPVIGHYQASYRDPNRDKIHGRIWRLTAKDRPLTKRPELEKMDTAQLFAQLLSPERWVRDQARRLLFFKDDAPALAETEALKPEASPALLYAALGVQAAHEAIGDRLLSKCLSSEEPKLRAFATRVWFQRGFADHNVITPDDEEDAEKRLANMTNDPHPRVRLEAVIAASYLQSPVSMEIACGALDHPRDRFIDYALANTVRALKPSWLPALESGKLTFDGSPSHLAFVLQTDGGQNLSTVLNKLLKKEDLSPATRDLYTSMLIQGGSAADVAGVFAKSNTTLALAAALASRKSSLPDLPLPESASLAITEWMGSTDAEFRAAALKLVQAFKLDSHKEKTRNLALQNEVAAFPVLASLAGKEAIPDFVRIIKAAQKPELQKAALQALASLDLPLAASEAAIVLTYIPKEASPGILGVFLEREGGPQQLSEAITKTAPGKETALALIAALATAGQSDPALLAVLQKAAGLAPAAAAMEYTPELVTKLIDSAKASGDSKRGAEVFRMAQAACTGCHKVGNEGGITGPDLSAIGRGMTPELITESLLWPKRQIKEGFFLTTATTKDGRIFSGYKRAEDNKTLTLLPPGLTETQSVSKADIKDRTDTGTLMPEALTAWMTDQQRLDLLAYLFSLGK
ncbi:MAG TPA: PVC-type heme-binding CxxCH protein [Verrucomicrobiales bacterium]|nr:PVC-type heme-binding CxxCH protein [Verrucomicrobiales bacterium]